MKKKAMRCYQSISSIRLCMGAIILLFVVMLSLTIISDLGIRTYLGLSPIEEDIGIKEYGITLGLCTFASLVEILVWNNKNYSYLQFLPEGVYHKGFIGNKIAFIPWEEVQQVGLLEQVTKDNKIRKQALYVCKRKCESASDIAAAREYHLDDLIVMLIFRYKKIQRHAMDRGKDKKQPAYWEKIVQEVVQYYPLEKWANILSGDENGQETWLDSKL